MSTPYITGRADWLRNDTFVLSAAGVSVALAASAFYSPLPLVIVIGIPFLLYCLSRPYELLFVMVFLIPFNFVYHWDGAGRHRTIEGVCVFPFAYPQATSSLSGADLTNGLPYWPESSCCH